jgi:hypothetical protein
MHKKFGLNPYSGGVLPPCSAFLSNSNPIIKDGKLIYRNMNRIFCFLSTAPSPSSAQSSSPSISTNLQISLTTFIIGLYIDEVQRGAIKHREDAVIHTNSTANRVIHQAMRTSPDTETEYTPKLSFLYSNGNAILPLITITREITPLNYYILLVLDRLENNPGLFFGNNSFATEDPINFALAALNIKLPI